MAFYGSESTPVDKEAVIQIARVDPAGHNHGDLTTAENVVGRVDRSSIPLPADRVVKVRYTAPKAACEAEVVAIFGVDTDVMRRCRVKVGISGLEELAMSESVHFELTYAPHSTPNWGTKALLEGIRKLGAAFYARFKKPIDVGNMSLKTGGLLDINADFMPPCEGHGEGHAVDILFRDMPEEERTWLKVTARELGFREGKCEARDGDPWHISITPDDPSGSWIKGGPSKFWESEAGRELSRRFGQAQGYLSRTLPFLVGELNRLDIPKEDKEIIEALFVEVAKEARTFEVIAVLGGVKGLPLGAQATPDGAPAEPGHLGSYFNVLNHYCPVER